MFHAGPQKRVRAFVSNFSYATCTRLMRQMRLAKLVRKSSPTLRLKLASFFTYLTEPFLLEYLGILWKSWKVYGRHWKIILLFWNQHLAFSEYKKCDTFSNFTVSWAYIFHFCFHFMHILRVPSHNNKVLCKRNLLQYRKWLCITDSRNNEPTTPGLSKYAKILCCQSKPVGNHSLKRITSIKTVMFKVLERFSTSNYKLLDYRCVPRNYYEDRKKPWQESKLITHLHLHVHAKLPCSSLTTWGWRQKCN